MRERAAIVVILLAFVALGVAASVINPLHEATDELRHYRFVRHIVQEKGLPVQGGLACRAQSHHPPLFYLLGALASAGIDTGRDVCYAPSENPFWAYRYWEVGRDNKNQYLHGADEAFPWRGEALAAHLVRFVNVLIGAGVVWVTWLTGRTIWPERPSLALGGAAFVAFNPMFVYMAGAINNDVIAALSGSAVMLACVRLLGDEKGLSRRHGVVLGALFGLALMSKFNLAAMALLIETAVTFVAWRRRQWRLWLEVNLLIAGVSLLVAGWWFIRNQMLYGEPTGVGRLTELWGVRNPAESWGVAVFELSYAWTSLWGRFGYGQVPLPNGIYAGLKWLTAVALAGLFIPLIRRRWDELARIGPPVLFLLLTAGLFFAVLFSYLLISPAGPMGRFFFPALPALALLLFYGLNQWFSLFSRADYSAHRSSMGWLALVVNVVMAGLTIVALFGYLRPAFALPPGFAADTAVPRPLNVRFDTFLTLRGYEVGRETVHPGEPVDIDLYWEVTGQPPGNYYFFVHLIDDIGTMVVQRDTHPGLGSFPSGQWRAGDRFIESIRFYLPETAYTPASADLSVGFYAPEGYRLGITDASGASLGDSFTLGKLAIEPATSQFPNPLDQNFNDELRLVGYDYNQRQLQAGDDLAVTLYWEALPALHTDYRVQLRLLDEAGNVWGQADGRPQSGQPHLLPLAPDLPSGVYQVRVALIDTMTKEPQNIIGEDGHWINNHLLLAKVRVRP